MKRRYILPGLMLILCGIYFLISALPGVNLPDGLFLVAVGAALLITRLCSRKRYGLTIAGFILFWLGIGRLMLDVLHIGSQYALVAVPLTVSLAFFLTHIFEYRRLGNWPIVPALVLLGFSVAFFLMLTPSVNAIFQPYYGTILPLLLIILGIVVLVRGGRRNKKAPQPSPARPVPPPQQWAQPPAAPVEPIVPVEPVDYVEPVAPVEPVVPVEPVDYVEPVVPVEPVSYVEPDIPVVEEAPMEYIPEEEPATVQPEPVVEAPVLAESVIYVEPVAEETPAAEVMEAEDIPEDAETKTENQI